MPAKPRFEDKLVWLGTRGMRLSEEHKIFFSQVSLFG